MVVSWQAEGLGKLGAGAHVWYRLVSKAEPDAPWQLGTLVATSEDSAQVQGGGRRAKTVTVPLQDVEPANPDILAKVPDLTSLSQLNEPSILDVLSGRYGDDVIYTTAGPVLIALNPCKRLPIYDAATVDEYRKVRSELDAQRRDPHVFLNAGKAFRDMIDNEQSQSMVISGESGAGKTETTKKAMQFFAQMSGGHGIEDQVLQTNPLLEAFGNAKTLRNHNSSRFGKLLEIHFNRSNHICGASIKTYLLEKSRVVAQIPGERSFHIFYQMLRGASAEERSAWRLPKNVSDFKYLNGKGAVTTIDGVDDAADFREVREAMTAVSIEPELQSAIFSIVAAVLWLGNVTFTARSDDEASVRRDAAFETAAALLQVPAEKLEFALTHRLMTVGRETYEKPLNLGAASDTRDALAKALYAALFSLIVERVNASLASEKQLSGRFIAILDIYGFESFTRNSFEQLCINYANERLQQQFNKHLFKLEQEEYDAEGIDWSHVAFEDNQDCLDCIDAKPPKGLGVMSVLDDQCNFPQTTDRSLCDTLRERIRNPRFSYKPGSHMHFVVEHYAGPVTYDCDGFLDKNRDTLSVDLVSMLQTTGSDSVRALLPYVQENLEGKNRATVASRFREQLLDLVRRLDETEMHFVRCIKPNYALKPSTFDQAMILQQLRCCGVLEVVRIAKAGYPTRYLHQQFADRYAELMPKAALRGSALDKCETLLAHFRVPDTMWQIGHTKLFFKAGVLGAMEDLWRRSRGSALVLQSYARMHLARRAFLRQRAAVTSIAAAHRGAAQRRRYEVLLREHRAAVKVQTAYRGHAARRERGARMRAIVTIQCAFRRRQFRRRCRKRERDMREQLQFAVARAGRVQEELDDAHARLAELDALCAEYELDVPGIRMALGEWRDGKGAAVAQAGSGALSMSDGSQGTPGVGRDWRGAAGDAQTASLRDVNVEAQQGTQELHALIKELRGQMEDEQQRSRKLEEENAALRNARSQGAPRRSGPDPTLAAVQRVQNDFDSHTAMVDDDLEFIQEVAVGTSKAAPDFNAEQELRNLKDRFDRWKETFKGRMKETYQYVHRVQRQNGHYHHRSSRAVHGANGAHRRETPRAAGPTAAAPDPGQQPGSPASDHVSQKVRDGIKGAAQKGSALVGRLQRRMSNARPSEEQQQPGGLPASGVRGTNR